MIMVVWCCRIAFSFQNMCNSTSERLPHFNLGVPIIGPGTDHAVIPAGITIYDRESNRISDSKLNNWFISTSRGIFGGTSGGMCGVERGGELWGGLQLVATDTVYPWWSVGKPDVGIWGDSIKYRAVGWVQCIGEMFNHRGSWIVEEKIDQVLDSNWRNKL